jgi:hypothetical protein
MWLIGSSLDMARLSLPVQSIRPATAVFLQRERQRFQLLAVTSRAAPEHSISTVA